MRAGPRHTPVASGRTAETQKRANKPGRHGNLSPARKARNVFVERKASGPNPRLVVISVLSAEISMGNILLIPTVASGR